MRWSKGRKGMGEETPYIAVRRRGGGVEGWSGEREGERKEREVKSEG